MDSLEKYGLDMHCTMILEEYREMQPVFRKIQEIVMDSLRKAISDAGIVVEGLESRIKEEKSLAGKLELKGGKYAGLSDITDILGARVITFFSEEVDKVAVFVDRLFDVDWENSVDKRKLHDLNSFGYNSLHYICRIPESLYCDPDMPEINTYRFEIQMRTALQHVWATIEHDTGYKTGVEIPREYLRNFNRIAGMLELIDEQFSILRTEITNYSREVQSLVSDGQFSKVPLNLDTYRSYLQLNPFDKLTRSIAVLNQAEIHYSSALPYLDVFLSLGFTNLGDLDNLVKNYSDAAYQLGVYEIGNTDLDIISSTVAIQDLLIVYIIINGGGVEGLRRMFDSLGGSSEYNVKRAERLLDVCSHLKFMNKR